MKCDRIGGCLKEVKSTWKCKCDADRITRQKEKDKHLSDVAIINQHSREGRNG